MKSLLQLWQVVALDMGDLCRVSTTHDSKTVVRRVENEGESFITLTLPKFGKDLERSLELGYVAPNAFAGFRRRGGLPLFLGGFLEQIFDTTDGTVLHGANPNAVFAIRQLAGMCAKIEQDCSPSRVSAAYKSYVECEQQVRASDDQRSSADLDDFRRIGRLLFASVFACIDGRVANFALIPKHGPGSTANRINGNAKYDSPDWTRRLEGVFPSSEYLLPNVRFHHDLDRADLLEPGHEKPVKVIHVPKTLDKPRIIAMEPSYMMFMQQALWREFCVELEADPLVGNLIGFTDQTPNQQMARIGSIDRSLATLDLSEASDRVSNQLVQALLTNHPHLRDGVLACRSESADVPGYGVIPLAKFASMGSALCFPFEAMVFLTIVLLGIERANGTSVHATDVKQLHGKVRIYGDDIVVPREYADIVSAMLETFGLKVNRSKSFSEGNFRESCGGDFFAGVDTTPVRARRPLPVAHDGAVGLVSWAAFRNLAYQRGLQRTTHELDREMVSALNGYWPVVGPDSPVLGRWSFSGSEPERIHPTLHRREVRGWVVQPKKRRNPLEGPGALLKFFLNKTSDLPVTERDHLTYSGRPVAVTLKLRWAPAD